MWKQKTASLLLSFVIMTAWPGCQQGARVLSETINGNINNRQRYLLCNCHNNSTITHPDQYTGVTDSWQHQIDLLFSQHKNILTHFFGNGRFRTLIFLVLILLGFSFFTDKFWPNSGVRIMHEGVLYSWIYGIIDSATSNNFSG